MEYLIIVKYLTKNMNIFNQIFIARSKIFQKHEHLFLAIFHLLNCNRYNHLILTINYLCTLQSTTPSNII